MWIILCKKSDDAPPQVFRPTQRETFPTQDAATRRIEDFAGSGMAQSFIVYPFGSDDP